MVYYNLIWLIRLVFAISSKDPLMTVQIVVPSKPMILVVTTGIYRVWS